MTKKHFQLIADTIKALPNHAPNLRAQKQSITLAFADKLEREFPRFNRALFLKACE